MTDILTNIALTWYVLMAALLVMLSLLPHFTLSEAGLRWIEACAILTVVTATIQILHIIWRAAS